MRKGELLNIRKDEVDRHAKLIWLEGKQTKNRNPRTAGTGKEDARSS